MTKTIDLEIIIATYNSEFWLKKTLTTLHESYLESTKKAVVVTVVDNASTDQTVQLLKSEYAWVRIVQLPDNHGFAFANNRVLEQSTARYCMLLNSDVESNMATNLDALIEFMDDHTEVGICTPRLEFTDGSIDPACHRGEPTPWAAFCYFFGLETLFPESSLFGQYHQLYKDLHAVHTIDACSGAALIIRATCLQQIGLLDEQFFMYAEDLDWCNRARNAGFHILYHPEVIMIHHKNKSGIKSSSKALARATRKHFYSTMIQYYDKHYRSQYPTLVRTLFRYLVILKQGAL